MRSASSPAIEVEDLSVWFRTTQERKPTLKRELQRLLSRKITTTYVDALDGVSFVVPKGCIYGVIGRNGAGKSTLLRTIAGVFAPSAGRVTVYGRVSLLLSLGVGFNKELTGRENILLGGLAAGMPESEIRAHLDEIIEFADIGEAIDYPVRTYSSGMQGRLAFSVATHLDPEIVLIDEALAAGDAAFKMKCQERMRQLCEGDTTVVLVSHGLSIIKKVADQVLWLESGLVQEEGPAAEVIAAYLESQHVGATPESMEDM